MRPFIRGSHSALLVRVFRFGITGVMVTGVHVLVAGALLGFAGFGGALSNGIAFWVATAVSWVAHTTWSFSSRLSVGRSLRFVTVSLIGCAVAMSVAGAAESAGLPAWAGIVFVVMSVPPLTFVLHNFWTYAGTAGR